MKKVNSLSVIRFVLSSFFTVLLLYIITLITSDLYFKDYFSLIIVGLIIYALMKVINFIISPLQAHFRKIVDDEKKSRKKDFLSHSIIVLGYIVMIGIQIILGILMLLGLDLLFADNFNILNIWLYLLIALFIAPTYEGPSTFKGKL